MGISAVEDVAALEARRVLSGEAALTGTSTDMKKKKDVRRMVSEREAYSPRTRMVWPT